MSIQVQLQQFEGPLALLLFLIRKEEMDIFDIKITKITQQYMDYIKVMRELDLELAGDFVAMAATLIHIKSRMLLPVYNEEGELVEQEDPRKELVQKLLEYQKYQEASQELYERPLLGRDVWGRGKRETFSPDKEGEILLEENALFSLISTYRKVWKAMKRNVHRVAHKTQSIASRIIEIKDRLIVGKQVGMSEMITALAESRKQVLITFLSLLELGKMGLVSLYQSENYGEIYAQAKAEIDSTAVSSVEEYENVNAEEIASSLMQTPVVNGALGDEEFSEDEEAVEGEGGEIIASAENSEAATDEDIREAEQDLNLEPIS